MDSEMLKVLSSVHGEILDLILGQLNAPMQCDEAQMRVNMRELGERLIEASMTE